MKKLIFGVSMMLTGFIGFAILCGASIAANFTPGGSTYYIDIWQLFGITPIAIGFLIFGIIGIIIAIFGLIQKTK